MRHPMKKKPHTAEFKFKVVLAALKGDKTVAELSQEFGIVSSQLHKWKREVLDKGSGIFGGQMTTGADQQAEVDKLHRTIGKLKVENDFLEHILGRSR